MRHRLPPVLQQREFALYWVVVLTRSFPQAMVEVAIGWQVYLLHHDPFDLALIGLAQFIPLPLLALPAGQIADRYSRRLVLALSLVFSAVTAAGLLVVTVIGVDTLWPFLVLSLVSGIGLASGTPALRALVPELVAPADLGSAMALRSVAAQIAMVSGPAVGGAIFAFTPGGMYAVALGLELVATACTLALHRAGGWTPASTEAPGLAHLLGGISFLRRSRVVLGAILLDLFAVLFGGAVALLPLFAKSVLHTGPVGLGILRSAPAVGALLAGAWLTRHPTARNAGPTLITVVVLFGVSMIVFGLSRSFLLSLVALGVSGFVDMISVNIRATAVAFATPDELRGRVNAVEMVFISASNQLGAFESGLAAALVGAVPAVVAGGVATVAIAVIWLKLFPELSRLDRMESLRPQTKLT